MEEQLKFKPAVKIHGVQQEKWAGKLPKSTKMSVKEYSILQTRLARERDANPNSKVTISQSRIMDESLKGYNPWIRARAKQIDKEERDAKKANRTAIKVQF